MYKINKNRNTGKLNEKKYILEGNIESSPVHCGRKDRGKTVYLPPSPFGERGYNK
jgi:hypothetical protein